MRKFAVIGIILTVIIVLAVYLLPTMCWLGGAGVEVRFHVVEAGGDGYDIKGAKIQLQDFSDPASAFMYPLVTTDAQGVATVSVHCRAGGSVGRLGKKNVHITIPPDLLVVEAEGYRPVSVALANVVGGHRWPLSKRVFDVELFLFKKP